MRTLDPDIERIEKELQFKGVKDAPFSNKPEADILEMQKPKPIEPIIPPFAVPPRIGDVGRTLVDKLRGAPTIIDKLKGFGKDVINQLPGMASKAMDVSQGITNVMTAPLRGAAGYLGKVREGRVNKKFEQLKQRLPTSPTSFFWPALVAAKLPKKDQYTDEELRTIAAKMVAQSEMVRSLAGGLEKDAALLVNQVNKAGAGWTIKPYQNGFTVYDIDQRRLFDSGVNVGWGSWDELLRKAKLFLSK